MIDFSQLTSLESAGLMSLVSTEPELIYGFRHALVQEAVYNSLMNRDKRALHQAVGIVLEQIYPERLEEIAPTLAEQFLEAGDLSRSRHYFVIAGDAANKIYANPEAELHYRRALKILVQQPGTDEGECEIRLHLCQSFGRVLELQSRFEEALDHYKEMERLAIRLGDRSLELAALIGSESFQLSKSIDNLWGQAYALGISSQIYAFRGIADRAFAASGESLRIAGKEAGPQAAIAIMSSTQAYLYACLGDMERAMKAAQLAVDSAWLHAPFWVQQSLGVMALVRVGRNELEEAQGIIQHAYETSRAGENVIFQTFLFLAECELFLAKGEYENLLNYSRKIMLDLERYGTWAFVPDKLFYEGKALLEMDRPDEARSVLLKAFKKSEEIGLNPVTWKILAALSGLEIKEGRQKSGKKYLHQLGKVIQLIVENIDDEALRNTFLSQAEVKKVWESF